MRDYMRRRRAAARASKPQTAPADELAEALARIAVLEAECAALRIAAGRVKETAAAQTGHTPATDTPPVKKRRTRINYRELLAKMDAEGGH